MSAITSDFIKLVASIWHRFSLENDEAETLTNMLAPMDDAGWVFLVVAEAFFP